jgi:putative nucleotidyltransferase with HDIG domain
MSGAELTENPFVPIPVLGVLETMLDALGARRPAVSAHCRRVAAYAVQLATQYGLAEDLVESIRVGGLLHDVGKLLIASNILTKPGRLTEREWQTLQSHSEQGFEMLRPLGFDDTVLDIVLYHHERHDASGYPDGLHGDAIPFAVRIVSVMDAFDALTSPRTYREALSVEAARTLLARESVDRYCPWVVSGLLSLPRTALDAVARGSIDGYRPDARPSPAVLRAATTPWTAGHVENPGHLTAW